MAQRIPKQFVAELLEKADIVDIVGRRMEIKKKGREFLGCCPFHKENTGSFTVSESKQFYHCFGCGAHGSAVSFIMEFEHLDYPAAIEVLANELDIPMPAPEQSEKAQHTEQQRAAIAALVFNAQGRFDASPATSKLSEYGVSAEVAKRYGLGWLDDAALQKLSSQERGLLDRMGLLPKSGTPGQIIAPLTTRRGQVTGWLNFDGTGWRIKSQFPREPDLFGWPAIPANGQAVTRITITDDPWATLTLSGEALGPVLTLPAHRLTTKLLRDVVRLTDQIRFVFIADREGDEQRRSCVVSLFTAEDIPWGARFVRLPEGETLGSLTHAQGPEAVAHRLASAPRIFETLAESAAAYGGLSTTTGRLARMAWQDQVAHRTRSDLAKLMLYSEVRRPGLAPLPSPSSSSAWHQESVSSPPLPALMRVLLRYPHVLAADPSLANCAEVRLAQNQVDSLLQANDAASLDLLDRLRREARDLTEERALPFAQWAVERLSTLPSRSPAPSVAVPGGNAPPRPRTQRP